mgnify:CR=1 FL=1
MIGKPIWKLSTEKRQKNDSLSETPKGETLEKNGESKGKQREAKGSKGKRPVRMPKAKLWIADSLNVGFVGFVGCQNAESEAVDCGFGRAEQIETKRNAQ